MSHEQRDEVLHHAERMPAAKALASEYRRRSEALGQQQTVQQDRAEGLNRLYQFFSRHDQDGDFIVERRYGKGGARYVKPTGEDTEFHWATEDDTLESLATEINDGDSGELLFHDPAFALRYRLDRTSHALYCGVDRFSSPFGYQLKRADGGGEARSCEVDLVESVPYLLGMDVDRLYQETQGVVMLGSNRRGQSVAVCFRECAAGDSAQWVAEKLAEHPADRVYTNDPAGLSFAGCDRLEALESVFARQFGRP